ncbi:MAG: MliC family protein [Rubrimonas sp.]|uniref:MliC family protein n=1 Tax=Rubrimonas sp. TaxID=2036015 RepID=UPI002FDE6BEA
MFRLLCAAAVLAPGLALAQPVQQAISATYLCDGGKVLQLAFVNLGDMSAAVVNWGGELVALRNVPGASGVFYADFDEQRGFRWRGKGDEGFFAHLEPDDSATEEVLLDGCKAVAAR